MSCDKPKKIKISALNSAASFGQVAVVVQVCLGQGRHGLAQVLGEGRSRGEVRLDQDGDGDRRGGRGGRGGRQVPGHRHPGRQVSQSVRKTCDTAQTSPVELRVPKLRFISGKSNVMYSNDMTVEALEINAHFKGRF